MQTHQELGSKLRLFFIDETSPGSIFWLPHGTIVFNRMMEYIRYYYNLKGYHEVHGPTIYDKSLWETSGHWDKYRQNMFLLEQERYTEEKVDDTKESTKKYFGMKAMNCICGDSNISMVNNMSVKLIKMNDFNDNQVIGYNESDESLVPTKQHNFLSKGKKECIELLFSDGRKLICTPDHLISTPDGWITASNLVKDVSYVHMGVTPPLISFEENDSWNLNVKIRDDEIYNFSVGNKTSIERTLAFSRLCGLMITDGSISKVKARNTCYKCELYTGHEIDYKNVNDDINKILENECSGRFRKERNLWVSNIHAKLTRLFVHFVGYGNRMENESKFPNFILNDELPIDVLRQFLSGMFGGDGWAPVLNDNNFTEIYISLSKSKDKLDNLKEFMTKLISLLEKAGVPNCSLTGPYKNVKGTKYSYRVKVPMSSIVNFSKYIGFSYCCHKSQRLTVVSSYYSLKEHVIKQYKDFERTFLSIAGTIEKPNSELRKAYEETINLFQSKHILCKNVSIPSKKVLIHRIRNDIIPKNIGGHCFYSPKEYLKELNAEHCFNKGYAVERGHNPSIFKLKLIAKTLVGNKDVYDISVNEKIQSFLANGIVVHNCPSHCLMYTKINPSYRDLPLRLAEFGILHRNEASGSLNGLFRVRKFQQDDSHIFCALEHIEKEILEILKFVEHTYGLFGMKYKFYVSTRPENFIGDIDTWNQAEEILKKCVTDITGKSKINIKEGDGAFYGPKIDIALLDSKNRENQCGTVQLDFNLPSKERFNLQYMDKDQVKKTPIIIHRAILGSLERFIGIVLEHTQGKLPLWLSPRQVGITTVNKEFNPYALKIKNAIKSELPTVQVDFDPETTEDLRNQIKSFERLKCNVIITVGSEEVENDTVTMRMGKQRMTMALNEFIKTLKDMLNQYKM